MRAAQQRGINGCQFYTDNGQGMLRCDITNMDARPRRPADCELDYGQVWQRAGFTCRSEQTGLTCFNALQHGFSLARAEQKVF